MTADELNSAMDALSDRLDHVGVGANTSDVSRVNKLIADWQDFYWGNLDQWPVTELQVWENNLPNMQTLVGRLETAAGRQQVPVTSKPKGPAIQASEVAVTGTWPLWMKVTAGSVLALALYKVLRKVHIL